MSKVMKDEDKKAIDYVLDNFDYDRVVVVMRHLDWKVLLPDGDFRVPAKEDLRVQAEGYFANLVSDPDTKSIMSGGLRAHKRNENGQNVYCLEFVLTRKESYL